jgi:hypothetical protein
MQTTIELTGTSANEFYQFFEVHKRKKESPFANATYSQLERDYGVGKEAGVIEVVLVVLAIAQDLVIDLIKDFIKDKLKAGGHTAKYVIVNERGEKLEITLNGLTEEKLAEVVGNFHGNPVSVESKEK